jgi:hypothetical protein
VLLFSAASQPSREARVLEVTGGHCVLGLCFFTCSWLYGWVRDRNACMQLCVVAVVVQQSPSSSRGARVARVAQVGTKAAPVRAVLPVSV